jgi:hypothetical protein
MLHINFLGTVHDWSLAEADLDITSSDEQVKAAAAVLLGVPASKFNTWTVSRTANDLTLRVEAVFGI